MARRLPAAGRLRRGSSRLPLPSALLVVCEGKTEERLLAGLRAHWRIPSVRVEITGQAGEPWALVERARALRTGYRRAEVETWVVFDRDEHPRWADAVHRARDLEFNLALSNPCVELWGLLLHQDQSAWIDRHVAQRALAQVHPGYHHDKSPWLDLPTVLCGLDRAHQRAEQLARRAAEGGDALRNPSTGLHHLIAAMQRLA